MGRQSSAGEANPQVMRTPDVLDINAIIMVRGKRPFTETIRLTEELQTLILVTKYIIFKTAGRSYAKAIIYCLERAVDKHAF